MDFLFGSIMGNSFFTYSTILFLHLLKSFLEQYKVQHKNNLTSFFTAKKAI